MLYLSLFDILSRKEQFPLETYQEVPTLQFNILFLINNIDNPDLLVLENAPENNLYIPITLTTKVSFINVLDVNYVFSLGSTKELQPKCICCIVILCESLKCALFPFTFCLLLFQLFYLLPKAY
jgi:hypothetical protein